MADLFAKLSADEQEQALADWLGFGTVFLWVADDGTVTRVAPDEIRETKKPAG